MGVSQAVGVEVGHAHCITEPSLLATSKPLKVGIVAEGIQGKAGPVLWVCS